VQASLHQKSCPAYSNDLSKGSPKRFKHTLNVNRELSKGEGVVFIAFIMEAFRRSITREG
jgi:hypothetical protein